MAKKEEPKKAKLKKVQDCPLRYEKCKTCNYLDDCLKNAENKLK